MSFWEDLAKGAANTFTGGLAGSLFDMLGLGGGGGGPPMPKPDDAGATPMPETPLQVPEVPVTQGPAPAVGGGMPPGAMRPQYQNLNAAMQKAMAQYLGR